MNDLPAPAVEHLYSVLVIIVLVATAFVVVMGGLWAGFVWLETRITKVSTALVTPVAERLALVEKSTDAAHRRIDEWLGKRP